jgi:hypothetical protein
MRPKERVANQILGRDVDRVPLMGGWYHGVANLATLAGLSQQEYLADPTGGLLVANRALRVDCMIHPIVPTEIDQIRTGEVMEATFAGIGPEVLVERAETIPEKKEKVLASFDLAQAEAEYRSYFEEWLPLMDDAVLIPNFWEAPIEFSLYITYGYGAFMQAVALYPEMVGRIYWEAGIRARARNEILVRLIDEYDLPPMLFTGSDICNQRGPMVSPAFLRQYYFPHVKYAFEPLLDAGIRIVRHCDGNVMPLIDDWIDVGYSGFQGFQYECGVDPYVIAAKRSTAGQRLIFFAGLNVSRTLPFGTIGDVAAEIEYVLDYTDGGQGLFFFTSSSIGPEVPLENVRYAYHRMANGEYETARDEATKCRVWPWLTRHGNVLSGIS